MPRTVIWATDGSPTAKREYPVAKDLAADDGAKLIVAHAGEMVGREEAGVFVDSTEALQATLERTVDDLKREGIDAELALIKASHRNAAQMMADFARDARADVVVVGNRGYGRVAAIFLGSFTFRLLQISSCPVLVVPTGQPPGS